MNYGKVPPDHKNFQIFANLFYNLLVKKNVASILDQQLIFLIPTLKGLMSLYSWISGKEKRLFGTYIESRDWSPKLRLSGHFSPTT